jgi:hypothetical protein
MKFFNFGLSAALALAVFTAGFAPTDADARRLGGGSSAGMRPLRRHGVRGWDRSQASRPASASQR